MQAIILAAGKGERLAPYTNDRPKCLVEIDGKPLLFYILQNLKQTGIEHINIVTGYRHQAIHVEGARYFHNKNFATTNMVESLFCAEEIMDDDILISYGDIVYERRVLEKLLAEREDIAVVVDDDWEKLWRLRTSNPLGSAETLIFGEDTFIKEIGDVASNYQQIQSQYIGLLKFSQKGIRFLKETFHQIKALPENQEVLRTRNKNKIYMTDILQVMINAGKKIKGVRVNGGWFEIDTKEDYELICRMHENGDLSKVCKLSSIAKSDGYGKAGKKL